jgi:hypothetical protein
MYEIILKVCFKNFGKGTVKMAKKPVNAHWGVDISGLLLFWHANCFPLSKEQAEWNETKFFNRNKEIITSMVNLSTLSMESAEDAVLEFANDGMWDHACFDVEESIYLKE